MAISINGSTGISGVNGSAATPAIQGGDSDTGIFFGTDTASVATEGIERLIVDANGNINIDSGGVFYDATNNRLAIGTTNPQYKLQVSQSASAVCFGESSSVATIIGTNAAGNASQELSLRGFPLTFTGNGGGGSEAARIDSSGRLLVGTTSARVVTNDFQGGGVGVAPFLVETDFLSAGTFANYRNDRYGPAVSFVKSRGTTPGSNDLVANDDRLGGISFAGGDGTNAINGASITAFVDGTPGTNDMPGRLVFSTTADGASSPTERMRIDSDGTMLLGVNTKIISQTTNPYLFFQAQSAVSTTGLSIESYGNNIATRYHFAFTNPNGVVGTISTNGTATAYNTSSDYRLKENVTPVTDGITRLQQLKPSRFNFIADPDTVVDGFIAHEVQTIVPEAITGEKDAVDDEGNPEYQGIDQSKLVPLLTAALQEAVAKIESLEARLTAAGI